jgi:hypothetical protein
MEFGSYFLFLQEQIKDIIIIIKTKNGQTTVSGVRLAPRKPWFWAHKPVSGQKPRFLHQKPRFWGCDCFGLAPHKPRFMWCRWHPRNRGLWGGLSHGVRGVVSCRPETTVSAVSNGISETTVLGGAIGTPDTAVSMAPTTGSGGPMAPAVSGQKPRFRGTVSDCKCMGSGVPKVLDRNYGVETHGAREPLKEGFFSTKNCSGVKKRSIVWAFF